MDSNFSDMDSNSHIMKSGKKKLNRRNSAENIKGDFPIVWAPNENLWSIQEQESDYSKFKKGYKSPNTHNKKIIYKMKKRKSEKSGESSRNYPLGSASSSKQKFCISNIFSGPLWRKQQAG